MRASPACAIAPKPPHPKTQETDVFDQMKAMGAVAGLLRNKDKLRAISEEAKQRIDEIRVEGEAGAGAVRVTVTGRMIVEEVHLEPALIAGLRHDEGDGGRLMAQSLITDATNDALRKCQAIIQTTLRDLAREHDLPDLPGGAGLDGLLGAG